MQPDAYIQIHASLGSQWQVCSGHSSAKCVAMHWEPGGLHRHAQHGVAKLLGGDDIEGLTLRLPVTLLTLCVCVGGGVEGSCNSVRVSSNAVPCCSQFGSVGTIQALSLQQLGSTMQSTHTLPVPVIRNRICCPGCYCLHSVHECT